MSRFCEMGDESGLGTSDRFCPQILTFQEQGAKILRADAFFCVYSLLGFRELRPGNP